MFAQDFWEELNTPNGIHIYSIAINDAGQIFLGAANDGAPGGVYRSSNNGASWDLVFDNGEFMIYPIHINNLGDIYIGRRGVNQLLVSYNNGDNWDTIPYPGFGNITEIQTLGQDTILVSSWENNGAFLARSYTNGSTWDTVFTTNNSNEYIQDIIITEDGDFYIGLTSYSENAGGVYKSEDGGNTWMFSGLFNQMISSLEINSSDDIFASSRGILQVGLEPGLFVLRNGEDEWQVIVNGPFVEDVVINSLDHIFYSSYSIYRSIDNGTTFEYIGNGLPSSPMGFMAIDDNGFLYLTSESSSNFLAKSINSTVSITEENHNRSNSPLYLFPNPAQDYVFIQDLAEGSVQYNIRIYNTMGSLVKQIKKDASVARLTINIEILQPGYYFLELHNENTQRIGRFIKY